MVFGRGFDEGELRAEFGGERLGAVAADGEAAAALGAVQREGGEDDGCSGVERVFEGGEVGAAGRRVGEEVEDGAVVPEIVAGRGVPGGDVGDEPLDLIGGGTEALAGLMESCGGEVEYGEVAIAFGE